MMKTSRSQFLRLMACGPLGMYAMLIRLLPVWLLLHSTADPVVSSWGIPAQGVVERPRAEIVFRTTPRPGLRVISGNLVYEEHLYKGGWRTRFWSPTGLIKPDAFLVREGDELPGLDDPIAGSFGLAVDGQDLWDGWRWKSARELPCEGAGCWHAVVELASEIRPVGVRIHTRVDGHPFLKRWLEITNEGSSPAAIGAVYPMSGYLFAGRRLKENLPAHAGSVFSLLRPVSFQWLREADFRWVDLPDGEYRYGGFQFGMPFAVVRNAVSGEMFLLHFAWSGRYSFEFFNDHTPERDQAWLHFRAGLAGPGPFRVLQPGETATTPAVYVGHTLDDLDGSVQALHRYLREAVLPPLPPGRVRPVEINSWGYAEDQISEESLKATIDTGADVGAELFTVDAGWWTDAGKGWYQSGGDWKTGSRLPNGLEPVFDYARSKGLLCGLWVEIERAGLESQLRKQHPDWVVKLHGSGDGRTASLDFTNPDVVKFAEETLAGLIERYKLDVFRMDWGGALGAAGGQLQRPGYLENSYWRHYEALYAMYARLRRRFPRLMMENCAGGGGRNDLGMLENFHWAQTSDEYGSARALTIYNGFTLAFPPEYALNFVGVATNENYRYGDTDFRFRSKMFGHLALAGVAPNMKEFPAAYRDRLKHHVRLYKTFIRPVLPTVKMFHHTPVLPGTEPGEWAVLEHATQDGSRAYAGVFRLAGAREDDYIFRPRGVEVSKTYKLTFDNTRKSLLVSGLELQRDGLRVRIGQPFRSELLLMEAQ